MNSKLPGPADWLKGRSKTAPLENFTGTKRNGFPSATAKLTQPMAFETGDRTWPFTWGMLLTLMRKAGGPWGQDFVSQFFEAFLGIPIISILSKLLKMKMWGHAAFDRQASPPRRSGPVMRLRRDRLAILVGILALHFNI